MFVTVSAVNPIVNAIKLIVKSTIALFITSP
jgi:hypothetical protein